MICMISNVPGLSYNTRVEQMTLLLLLLLLHLQDLISELEVTILKLVPDLLQCKNTLTMPLHAVYNHPKKDESTGYISERTWQLLQCLRTQDV